MPDLSNLVFEVISRCILVDFVRVLNEFENELIKVSFDIDALQLWINILVDEHKVRVDLKSTILTHNYSNLIALLCLWVNFCYRTILDQRRFIC